MKTHCSSCLMPHPKPLYITLYLCTPLAPVVVKVPVISLSSLQA